MASFGSVALIAAPHENVQQPPIGSRRKVSPRRAGCVTRVRPVWRMRSMHQTGLTPSSGRSTQRNNEAKPVPTPDQHSATTKQNQGQTCLMQAQHASNTSDPFFRLAKFHAKGSQNHLYLVVLNGTPHGFSKAKPIDSPPERRGQTLCVACSARTKESDPGKTTPHALPDTRQTASQRQNALTPHRKEGVRPFVSRAPHAQKGLTRLRAQNVSMYWSISQPWTWA